jgi:hypothetical protein
MAKMKDVTLLGGSRIGGDVSWSGERYRGL